jgi:hypothetical protein
MSEKPPSLHSIRDTAERLRQLATKSTLDAGDKQACTHAAESLAALADTYVRLEAAETFLHEEARRLETALAALYRRPRRQSTIRDIADIVDHIRHLRTELEHAWPVEPRTIAFGATG